jgi:hypothetical protein
MPEAVIQRADQYLADKFNNGVLTPDKSAALVANPEVYNNALAKMYTDKYSGSFEDFDKFKSAYQSQYGDPFKKKEPSAPSSTEKKVQSFDTKQRIQQPLTTALQEAATPTQETSLENYVTPSDGAQLATFQTGGERKQIPVADALQPLSTQSKQQEADALRSEQYSKGLLQNTNQAPTTAIPKTDFSVASESTVPQINKPLTFDEAKNLSFGNVPTVMDEALGSANEFLAPLNKAVYDAIPQAVLTLNNIAGYGAEKFTGTPSPYTFEEYNKAYDNSSPMGKAAMWLTGIKEATMWHDFNEENMSASPEFEQSILGGVSSGLGQGITMIAGTGAVNMLSKGKQLLDAAKYANALSKSGSIIGAGAQAAKTIATQPATYVAASQVFNSEFQDAYNQTGNADAAFKSAVINTVGSAGLEAMPIMSFMGRLDKVTGGGLKQTLINGFKGGLEEATTEVLQQALSNMVASNLYDDTRNITDGMVQSGEVGGLTGFALNIIGASLGAKLRATTDPYEAQEIKKTQEYVQAKKDLFDKEQEQIVANMENQIISMNTTEMQKQLNVENITPKEFSNVMQVMQTMPNSEAITPKTVGVTNKINGLLVEKQDIYSNVLSVEQQEVADKRAEKIDTEIRDLTNTIGEIYANPSKKQIEENDNKIGQQVPGEERIGQESEQAKPIETTSGTETETSRDIQAHEEVAPNQEEDLTDPEVIATKYHEERTNPVHITPAERAIADLLRSGVSKEGVRRQGDVNKFNNSMARAYFKEGANTIDQVAQQASSTINPEGDGNEVTPEDVWDFMNKYPQGPDQIDRPAGNPRLRELSDKYEEVTGKQLNKTIAKKIAEAKSTPPQNIKEDPNSVIDKYTDENGDVKLDELEKDISALPFLYDLTPEETKIVENYVKESRKADRTSSESTSAIPVEQPERKTTIADKSETIREIKDKKLTHVKGVAMGSGVAKGTYLSTEKGNRYQGRGKKFNADVNIKNPYTTSENNLNKERGDVLKSNINQFSETDFEGAEIPPNPIIDDLSNSGTEKLADLFTKNLQDQGYDSMYFPESKTQEGELVVFDKGKVTLTEDPEITDAMKMSREAYDQKYPEGNYDEARAEYTKDTENLQEANKKGETLEGVILMEKGFLKAVPMDTRFKKGTDKLKQAWIKATRVGGAIPFDLVFNYSYIRKNTIAQKIEEVEHTMKQVEKSITKHLGGKSKVTKEQLVAIDHVLHGETPSIILPSEVLAEVSTLRSVIDGLSLEMKNSGMLSDSMQAVIDQNMGTYLNRSYKKWNDPVWKENVPEETMNKAVAYLKNEYIKFYTAKYQKSQEAFKNKDKRIRDFRTTIANKQSKVDENNAKLAEYKSKHDAYIAKIDNKIKSLKKRPNKEQVGPDLSGKTKQTKHEGKIAYLEAVKADSIKDFNSIYDTKKSQFDKQNAKIEAAIAKAENAAYNMQQKNYPEVMKESLDKFTSPDDGEISALINQILYAPTDNINPSGKAGAISGSFLKQRSERLNQSPEIRELMGEYQDPYINFLSTANKMITSIQNYTFQKQLKAQGMGTIFSDKPTGDFHRQIEGDAWKGLIEDGDVYTTETFEAALKELNGMIQQDMSPGMKTFRAIVSLVKVGKTAASAPGAVANYISNVSNIVSNAWNPTYAAKKWVQLSRPQLVEEIKDLKKLGILGQSVSGRELADRIKDTAGYVPFETYLESVPGLDIFSKGIKGIVSGSKKIFEVGDEYARVIGFYAEVERYRTVHTDWTETQLRDNAAKIVSNNSPTYDLAYPWVKNFRNSPWFSTFATFPAEIYRTTTNQAYQIKKDLSKSETRAIGVTRLAGILTSMGFGAYQIMQMATTMISGDDEDERDLRLFVPEYSKFNPLLLYRKDGDEYTYTDAGRFTYYNNFISPIIAFSNGDIEKEEFDSRIYNSIGQMLQPFTDINIVTEAGADIAFGYKSGTDEKIYSENDSNTEKLRKISEHIGNKLEPTNVKVGRSFYDLAVYGKTKHGSEVTLETAALSAFGVKSRVLNVTKQFTYQFYTQKEQGDSDKNAFERSYKNARSEEEKSKAIEIYKTQVVNQINKMSYLYHAALRQGANLAEINKHTAKMPQLIKVGIRTNSGLYDPNKAADILIKMYIKDLTNKK